MAAVTVDLAYMKANFPILAIVSPDEDPFVAAMIVWATECIDEDTWATKCTQGIANLTAHFIQLNRLIDNGGSGGDKGSLTSEKVGDLQRNYAQATSGSVSADAGLMQTSFGREYLRLRNSLSRSPLVI